MEFLIFFLLGSCLNNDWTMNILLTSAGRRTYMVHYFMSALEGKGKVFASNSILTHTLKEADGYFLTPNIYDGNYIEYLLEKCIENKISVIIPLFDIDLPVLAKNKNAFEAIGVKVIVSDSWVTNVCNDKWESFNFLRKLGLPQMPSYIVLEEAVLAVRRNELRFPVFLKPRWGMGSIGICVAENEEEMIVLYNKLKRDIFRTYLKYESSANAQAPIIIQQGMIGQEIGIEVLNDLEGNFVSVFAKKKVAMRSGETDVAEVMDSRPFSALAITISSALKHIGVLDVDCFMSDDGKVYVLEMNCRFGGQYPFSHLAGVNIPLQIVRWLEGKPTDPSILVAKIGVVGCKEIEVSVL